MKCEFGSFNAYDTVIKTAYYNIITNFKVHIHWDADKGSDWLDNSNKIQSLTAINKHKAKSKNFRIS